MKKNIFVYSFVFISLISCNHQDHAEHEASNYTVTSRLDKDTIIDKEYVAQIHAYQHIELRSLEKGYLNQIYVDEGQHVKKGQLLFQIQPNIYLAEADKARSEVEFAEVEYKNTLALADQNIVSQSEVLLAKSKLSKALADLSLAQAHLSFTEIRAPFDGIIGKFEDVRLGSLLDEGELLTTLSDNSKMWVYFNVPESEYLDYAMREKQKNEHVHLQLANNTIFSEEGIIETIESDFNNRTGNIAFRATFNNPDGLLRHGQTGSILWPKVYKNNAMIPQKASFEVLEKKYVFVVNDAGVVQPREIEVAGEIDHIFLIRSGLELNDKFLLEGIRKVKNGDTVNVEYIAPQKVFNNLQLHAE